MSHFDDAIATYLTHPAASGADPLTDSLLDQVDPPAPREGLEHEPIRVPHPWGFYAAALLLSLVAHLLVGCGGGDDPPMDDGRKTTQPVDCASHLEQCQ